MGGPTQGSYNRLGEVGARFRRAAVRHCAGSESPSSDRITFDMVVEPAKGG